MATAVGLMGPLTGLSSKNAANHMLGGEIQTLMQGLWSEHSAQLKSLSAVEVDSFVKIMKVFNVIMSDSDNSCEAAMKQGSLPVDMAKCFIVYFSHLDQLREHAMPLSPSDMLNCFSSVCARSLEDICSDKHLDMLATTLPCLAASVAMSESSTFENKSEVFSFLTLFVTTLSHLAASYSNSKKLFVLCTGTMLSPCLDMYRAVSAGGSPVASLLTAVDSLVSSALFDDVNNIKELSQISLESIESRKSSLATSDIDGKSKDKKKQIDKKKIVFSYHAEFLFVIGAWIASQSEDSSSTSSGGCVFLAGKAIQRVLDLYVQASRAYMTNSPVDSKKQHDAKFGDQSSFVVKWRQHVKRVLHTSICVAIAVRASCTDNVSNDAAVFLDRASRRETLFLLTWSSVLDSVSAGLRGDSDSDERNTDDDRDSGAIPNHDSMIPYLDHMKKMGSMVVSDVFAEDGQVADGGVLFAQILFLGKLFSVNYRTMLDMLPSLIQIICKSCNNDSKVKEDEVDYHRCRHVTEQLLLQLLKLYSEIRNLDTFIQVLIVESFKYPWNGNNLFEQFYSLLTNEMTQTVLISAIGSMPDGQRKLVWEAIYVASATDTTTLVVSGEADVHSMEVIADDCVDTALLSPSRFFIIESVLIPFLVAQENQNHRPVPTFVLTSLLTLVVDDLNNSLENEYMPDLDVTSRLQLIAVIFQIAGTRLSASVFSPLIAPYPYEMKCDSLSGSVAGKKQSAEQDWVDFCMVAASVLGAENGYSDSPLKTVISHSQSCIADKSRGDVDGQFLGARLASCGRVVFAAVTLFAASSDPLSPIVRHLNKSNHEHDASVLINAHTSLQNEIILDLLCAFSLIGVGDEYVLSTYPFLCNLLMKEFPKWGIVVNGLLENEPSPSDLSVLNNVFMALVQTSMNTSKTSTTTFKDICEDIGTSRSLQAHIIDALSSPHIEEIPFVTSIIVQSIAKMFDRVVSRSDISTTSSSKKQTKTRGKKSQTQASPNTFDAELLIFEMSLLQFPVKLLSHNWESVCRSCCAVLQLLTNKYNGSEDNSQCDPRDALLMTVSLTILADVSGEVMSSSPETTVEFLVTLLTMMTNSGPAKKKNTLSTDFVEGFSHLLHAFVNSSVSISRKLCERFDSLLSVLFQCGFCKVLGSLLDDVEGPSEEKSHAISELGRCLIMLLQRLSNNGAAGDVSPSMNSWQAVSTMFDMCIDMAAVGSNGETETSTLPRVLLSTTVQSFSALLEQKPLLSTWSGADKKRVGKTFKKLENVILSSAEVVPGDADMTQHFSYLAKCYRALVHISSVERMMVTESKDAVEQEIVSSLFVVSGETDACLVELLTSTTSGRGSGWLTLLAEYLSGQAVLDVDGLKSYLSDGVVDLLFKAVLESINITTTAHSPARDLSSTLDPSVLFLVVKSLLTATPPLNREREISKPLMHFIGKHIRLLGDNELFSDAISQNEFMSLFAAMTSLLEFGNNEWREGTKEGARGLKSVRNSFRKSVTLQCCDCMMDISTTLLSVRHLDLSEVEIFVGKWNYGTLLDIICETLRSQLKLELQHQFEVSQLMRKRKRSNNSGLGGDDAGDCEASDSVGRLFDTCFAFLASASSQLVYLSANTSRRPSFESVQNFKRSACGLISLLTEVLSCVSVPVINSYIGSIVLLFRHLLFVASSLIASTQGHPVASANNAGKDVMALLGRALMAVASSKHLQKHAYLIVAAIIDSIGGLSTGQRNNKHFSKEGKVDVDVESFVEENALNFGEGNEILREHLFPGIFALFDRCRSGRERKQIFASLRTTGGSRTLYTDLHTLYQQDFKFIGKA